MKVMEIIKINQNHYLGNGRLTHILMKEMDCSTGCIYNILNSLWSKHLIGKPGLNWSGVYLTRDGERMLSIYLRQSSQPLLSKNSMIQQLTPRPSLENFMKVIEFKLSLNDHKVHWSNLNFDDLLSGLKEELKELEIAINHQDFKEAIFEAADVGAWAMMMADVCSGKLKEEEE